MAAVLGRWPRAVLQFEDFEITKARPLLDRYRNDYLVFNDDIQASPNHAAGVFAWPCMHGRDRCISPHHCQKQVACVSHCMRLL